MTKDIMEGISPLPWHFEVLPASIFIGSSRPDGQSFETIIVRFDYGRDFTGQANAQYQDNAAYIVHACNLYPELVEALERLTMMAEGVPLKALDTVIWTQDARALIAKCKAGSE